MIFSSSAVAAIEKCMYVWLLSGNRPLSLFSIENMSDLSSLRAFCFLYRPLLATFTLYCLILLLLLEAFASYRYLNDDKKRLEDSSDRRLVA